MSMKVAPTKRTNKAKQKKRAAASSRVTRTEAAARRANGSATQRPTHAEVRDLMDVIEQIGCERDKTFHDPCQRSLRGQAWLSLFLSLRRQYGDEPFGIDEVLSKAERMVEKSEAKGAGPLVRTMGLLMWGLKPREYSSVVAAVAELGSRGRVVGPEVDMPTAICLTCLVDAGFYV
jgi:hypothetical protein